MASPVPLLRWQPDCPIRSEMAAGLPAPPPLSHTPWSLATLAPARLAAPSPTQRGSALHLALPIDRRDRLKLEPCTSAEHPDPARVAALYPAVPASPSDHCVSGVALAGCSGPSSSAAALPPRVERPASLHCDGMAAKAERRLALDDSGRLVLLAGSTAQQSGRWAAEEDAALKAGVAALGARSWKTISAEFMAGLRSDVQCLHRWQKVLRPGLIKGPWSPAEDEVIKKCMESGIRRWSEIAARIP